MPGYEHQLTQHEMTEHEWLAARFEEHRTRLRAVGYRMLGSVSEVDDAVQEAWLRVSRADASSVENLGGWLTTIVARVCLNMLRSRESRREEQLEVRLPDPIVSRDVGDDPEQQAILADSVGLALQVILETLAPAERLAFVLHDIFAVSFDEIAGTVGRSPEATRQLASRARRRVRGAAPAPDADISRPREIVNAFQAAARDGDFDRLLSVLDPDVVLRTDVGALPGRTSRVVHGAHEVIRRAMAFRQAAPSPDSGQLPLPALVNGAAGIVNLRDGQPVSVMGFTIAVGRIVAIDILADPVRLRQLDLSALEG